MTYTKILLFAALLTLLPCTISADDVPTVSPKMMIETETGQEENTTYSGSAPIVAHFTANPENVGTYTATYRWTIYEEGKKESPNVIRYEADMDYTFNKSTTYYISLYAVFVQGQDTLEYDMENPFTVTPSESSLNLPNTFTPNGDGYNDIFKVKDGYKSIVKFHGYIFNRWGKKLFEWTDISKGWDGKSGGTDVADGVYFCRIDATGADGKKYNIKKAVNLLRKHIEE